MTERGIDLAHTTFMLWIGRCVSEFEKLRNRFTFERCQAATAFGISTRSSSPSMARSAPSGAVDQEGYVLDGIVQIHRNTKAARRKLIGLLRKQKRPPKQIITDKLSSYAAARRMVMPNVEHRSHTGLNNRAENSHVPIRKTGASDVGLPYRCADPSYSLPSGKGEAHRGHLPRPEHRGGCVAKSDCRLSERGAEV
jgi:DDE domain